MSELLIKENLKTSKIKKKKILWVDNETHLLKTNGSVLNTLGYKVTFAQNGLEAMEKMRNNPPDLILLNIMIPGINGFLLCGILKNDFRFMKIPLIVITEQFSNEVMERVKSLGADAYISKPFKIKTLLSIINNFSNGKKPKPRPINFLNSSRKRNKFWNDYYYKVKNPKNAIIFKF